MSKLILDSRLRETLGEGKKEFEVVDESGSVVGYYLPRESYVRFLYDLGLALPSLTPEERERVRMEIREGKAKTTPEVLSHLRELDERLRGSR